MARMKNFVIKGDICHCKGLDRLETIPGGYAVCEEGVSAGAFAELPEKYSGLPLKDHSGKMILPGLVDLHIHAPQYAFRGSGMDMELLEWLDARVFPEEARYAGLDYAEKAYEAFVRDITAGPNTRAAVFATVHVPATLRLMEMLEAAGICAFVGKVNMDRNSHRDLQEQDTQSSAKATVAWLEACTGRFEHVRPILTPRFIPACSDDLMRRLREIQEKYHLPLQSHLSENKGEVAWVKELCPDSASYGDAYRRFGLFGGEVPTIMAHCVWSGEEEIALMRQNSVFVAHCVWSGEEEIALMLQNNVFVAHCPQSNANLASGIAPVRRFLERGLKVGLGSDVGAGCHPSIFRAMSDAVQASKLYSRLVDETAKPLAITEAFYLATLGGGEFFGKAGSFTAGYEFDALVVDDRELQGPNGNTPSERLEKIAYLSDDRHITEKYVRGVKVK
jgi:guanine deaminase